MRDRSKASLPGGTILLVFFALAGGAAYELSRYAASQQALHLVVAVDHLYCIGGEDRKKHRSDAVFRLPLSKLLSSAPSR